MSLEIHLHNRITDIEREAWNRLACSNRTPFYEWEWLALLEESGSINEEHGWLPLHLVLHDGGKIVAALPLYLKGHSHGEFVFDYGWADIARQLDISYYPKLVGTAPATPSGHYSILTDPEYQLSGILEALQEYIGQLAAEQEWGGVSFLFSDRSFGERLPGYTAWQNQSYLWINRNYRSFNDYLAEFTKNQRRNIRREWASINDQGLEIRSLTGSELTPPVMERMYQFYLQTNAKFGPWAARFLNRDFFMRLPEFAAERTVIFAAVAPGAPVETAVGMSMCVYKGDWLFGRYWGGDEAFRNLHFAACYYAPMRWMIERGMRYFDPGAGSPHKLRRGFMPHLVTSFHRFTDPRLQQLFSSHIEEINRETGTIISLMEEEVPYHPDAKLAIRGEIDTLFSSSQSMQEQS